MGVEENEQEDQVVAEKRMREAEGKTEENIGRVARE